MWKVSTDHGPDPKPQICLFHDLTQAALRSAVLSLVMDCRYSVTALTLTNDTSHPCVLVLPFLFNQDLKNNYQIRKLNISLKPLTTHDCSESAACFSCISISSTYSFFPSKTREKSSEFPIFQLLCPSISSPLLDQKVCENFWFSVVLFSSCNQLLPVNLNWLCV